MVRALVTGGAGFIGSHIVEALAERGLEVTVLDSLVKGRRETIQYLVDRHRVHFVEGDVRSRDIVDKAMNGADYVFHLAATGVDRSMISPDECIGVNVQGSYNVFRSASDHKVKKVIYSSSSSVYGNPTVFPTEEDEQIEPLEPYGAAKLMAEHLIEFLHRTEGLNFAALRYFNVYGIRQDVHAYYTTPILDVIGQGLRGQPIRVNARSDQAYDFTHVSDVVRANLLAMESDVNEGSFNVGTGKTTSYQEVAEILMREIGVSGTPSFNESKKSICDRRQADTSKAERLLGFKAQVFPEEGLRMLVRDIKTNNQLD